MVGRHSKIHFWKDNFLGSPLIDLVEDSDVLVPPLDAVVGDFVAPLGWTLPTFFFFGLSYSC